MLDMYRNLLTCNALLIMAVVAVVIFVIRPMKADVDDQKQSNQKLREKLLQTGYPLVPTQVLAIKRDLKEGRANVRNKFNQAFFRSRDEFPELEQDYSGLATLQLTTELDYQEKYLAITQELQNRRVFWSPETLGLSEFSTAEKNYRLVVHLWVARNVCNLAVDNHLDLAGAPLFGGESRPTARISVLPLVTWSTPLAPNEAFAEEYPVEVTVTGKVDDFCSFLMELTRDGGFLPLQRVYMRKIGIDYPNKDEIEATLVCSGFLMLKEIEGGRQAPPEEEKTKIIYKRGT